jgi:hypothetical protein
LGRTARTSLGIQGIDFCAGILWSQKITADFAPEFSSMENSSPQNPGKIREIH